MRAELPPELTREELLYLKKTGKYSDAIIARMYGKSLNWVRHRKRKWGLIGMNVGFDKSDRLRELKDKYIRLTNQGYKHDHAAKKLRIGRVTLTNLKKEWGLGVVAADVSATKISERGIEEITYRGITFRRVM
jgi:hypothetical protein